MPAGDLITQPWQFEIRAFLMGQGSRWLLDGDRELLGYAGVSGPKTNDLPYTARKGSFGGEDIDGDIVLGLPLYCIGVGLTDLARQVEVMDRLEELEAAWAHVGAGASIRHDWYLPGRRRYMMGRPRGLAPDLSHLYAGRVKALATFVSVEDPTVFTVAEPP